MSETRLRELFDEAAEEIAIGPAPDRAGFVSARRTRRRLATVCVGLVAAAAVSVVVAVTMVDGSPERRTRKVAKHADPDHWPHLAGLCQGQAERVHLEGAGPYRRTPQALGRLFTNPVADEHAVVHSADARSARVVLLRGDGTAWATLTLRQDQARGWYLSTALSCPGRFMRTYWQHQPQF